MNISSYISSSLQQLPHTTLQGEVYVPAPNKHFRRIPNDWILYIILDGSMKIREEKQEYLLSKGDALILSPGKCHYGLPVNDVIHYCYTHFYWDTLKELSLTPTDYQERKMSLQKELMTEIGRPSQTDMLLLPKRFHLSPGIFEEVTEDMHQFLHLSQRVFPHQQSMNDCFFLMILLKLSRAEVHQTLPKTSGSLTSSLPVIAYLKEHHREKLTSRHLEEQFHHNFDYMNRKFKESTGTTIFQFLEKYRIEESKKLLASKRFSVNEIAESLGFCNAFYFSRVFKKHENITPSDYKKRH